MKRIKRILSLTVLSFATLIALWIWACHTDRDTITAEFVEQGDASTDASVTYSAMLPGAGGYTGPYPCRGDSGGGGSDAGSDAHADAASDSGGGGSDAGSDAGLHVVGNTLVDHGSVVRLLGVDVAGTEYQCSHNVGIFDAPNDVTLVTPMNAWNINAIRVPLNEVCWLGINGAPAAYSGANYISALTTYVQMIRAHGFYVIVDLHWNVPDAVTSSLANQQPMADAAHSPTFWNQVAGAFKGDPGILYDLYNEPYVSSWSCWLSGCSESSWNGFSGTYNTAGMQSLLNSVRSSGATNVVMAGGIAYANDLSSWLANKPVDTLTPSQVIASHHSYNFNTCASSSCWTSVLAPVAASVPIITGELGEDDCAGTYINSYMAFADANGISYMAWAWNTQDCASFPAVITDYTGTPTSTFGSAYKAHLLSL